MNRRIISLLIGIAAIVIGIVILVSHFKAQKVQTAKITAKIIRVDSELENDTDGLETRYYYPVIEYTVGSQSYETRLPDSGTTNSTEYKVGDSVEIKYNPDNPNEISKEGSVGGLIGGIFFIVVGIVAVFSIFRV